MKSLSHCYPQNSHQQLTRLKTAVKPSELNARRHGHTLHRTYERTFTLKEYREDKKSHDRSSRTR